MSEITVPKDYNQDKNEIDQEELLASIGLGNNNQDQQDQQQNRDVMKNKSQRSSGTSVVTRQVKNDQAFIQSTPQEVDVEEVKTEVNLDKTGQQFLNIISSRRNQEQKSSNNQQDQNLQQEQEPENDHNFQQYQEQNDNIQSYMNQENEQNTGERQELLTVTIDLGENNQENIVVYEGDDPRVLAVQFSQKHQLNPKLTELLANQIENNIDQVMQEKIQQQEMEDNQDNQENDVNNNQDMSHQENFDGTMNIHDQAIAYEYAQFQNSSANSSPFRNTRSIINQQYQPQLQGMPKISDKSKQIAMQKRPQSTGQSVYDRLFRAGLEKTKIAQAKQLQDQLEEQQRQQKQMKSPKQKKPNDLNYGVRLYQKCVKRKEEIERYIEQQKEQAEQKEQSALVFKPQLSKSGRTKSACKLRSGRREDQLIEYGKLLREKKDKARIQLSNEQDSQYEYKPSINKKSQMIIMEKSGIQDFLCQEMSPTPQDDKMTILFEEMRKNKFNQLYEDAKQRGERQNHIYSTVLDKECTFKPSLVTLDSNVSKKYYSRVQSQQKNYNQSNNESKQDVPDQSMHTDQLNKSGYSNKLLSEPVFNRLVNYGKDSQSKINVKQNNQNIDPKTGRPYFKPQTGRSPENRNAEVTSNIGDHLYKQHKRVQEKQKKMKRDEELKLAEMKKQPHQSQKLTSKIVEQTKQQRLSEIFDVFDSDGDGIISAHKIDVQKLPTDLVEIFTPLLCEMEEINQTLDKDEFIDASLRLFNTLNVHQRNLILAFRRIPKQKQDYELQSCTFQPQVCARSMKMAMKQNSSQDSNASFADRLYMKKLETENRIQKEKEQKEKQQLIGCTFQPNICSDPQQQSSYYSHYFTHGANGYGGIKQDQFINQHNSLLESAMPNQSVNQTFQN